MVGAEYTIYKRGSDGKRSTPIDKFTLLKIEQRWTEPSKWSMESTGLSRIPLEIGEGIIIYRNGTWFFSGIVEAAEESCNEADNGIISWTAEGRDVTSLLERRLVLPDPVNITFGEDSIQDVLTDSAEGAIRRYVERNAGASAATGRRLGNLTIDAITPDPDGEMRAYRLKALDKVCSEIGAGELSPEITWNPETGAMELEVNARREKAAEVVFAPEYGNVLRWSKKRKLPKKNAIWAISGDKGADQQAIFAKQDESIAAYGRFEGFIKDSVQMQEAKDGKPAVTAENVTAILTSKANEAIRKGSATETYSVEVREGAATMFYTDWRCGDRVTCVIDGESIISTIDSVSITFNDDGEKVQATIGDVEKGIFAAVFEEIVEMQKAIETEQSTSSAAAITSGTVEVADGGLDYTNMTLDTSPVDADVVPVNGTRNGTLSQLKIALSNIKSYVLGTLFNTSSGHDHDGTDSKKIAASNVDGLSDYFNTSTGHDHDGTDSKKITAENVDGLADYFDASTGHDHDGTNSKKISYANVTDTPAFETSASNIKPDGTASAGSLSTIARADHIHPQELISVANGGTGRPTLTANSVLVGNGVDPVKLIPTHEGVLYASGDNAEPYFTVLDPYHMEIFYFGGF